MKPGPPPKPTALKLLEGYRKDRINENEPCPPPAVDLSPPDGLMTPEAIAEWHRTAPALAASGVLTTADITGFVMYCNLYAQYINISKITLDCEIVEAPRTGTPMRHPAVDIKHRTIELMLKIMIEYGMTPASRSRITISQIGQRDEMEEFLNS